MSWIASYQSTLQTLAFKERSTTRKYGCSAAASYALQTKEVVSRTTYILPRWQLLTLLSVPLIPAAFQLRQTPPMGLSPECFSGDETGIAARMLQDTLKK
jgi:hypothetical protein